MTGILRLSLVDQQLKHFKLGLQALSKIGTELLVEALPSRLILRCINATQSAYLSLTFHARYFETYDVFNQDVVQAGVLMKQFLAVLRTQRIGRLNLDLGSDADWLEAVAFCDSGLRKTYRMRTTEADILQATVDQESFPIRLTAEAQALNRLLLNFQGDLEEMTLVAFPPTTTDLSGAVQLHSHCDPNRVMGSQSPLMTKLAVDARRSFLDYQHAADGMRSATFNVKDFRAMLSLCEQLGRPLTLRLEGPGLPLVVEPAFGEGEQLLEAQLVLATLVEAAVPEPMAPMGRAGGVEEARLAAAAVPVAGLRQVERLNTAGWDDVQGGPGTLARPDRGDEAALAEREEEQEVGSSQPPGTEEGALPGMMTTMPGEMW